MLAQLLARVMQRLVERATCLPSRSASTSIGTPFTASATNAPLMRGKDRVDRALECCEEVALLQLGVGCKSGAREEAPALGLGRLSSVRRAGRAGRRADTAGLGLRRLRGGGLLADHNRPRPYQQVSGCPTRWAFDVERQGKRATVEVELSAVAWATDGALRAAMPSMPAERGSALPFAPTLISTSRPIASSSPPTASRQTRGLIPSRPRRGDLTTG